MSGLNSMYISSLDLEPYFVSNQNGTANAFGTIYFYVDDNRTQAKNVYELVQGSGSPPNYTYTVLPNPLTLSAVGTIQDAGGNNVALYYYPYDQFGNEELYYIEVYDQYGNLQFTREAWPYPWGASGGSSTTTEAVGVTNQITNPQFAQVLFNPSIGLSASYSGSGTQTINFAPDWALTFTYTGSGVITLNQTAVAGGSAYPFNPPYVLTIAAGANITSLSLVQTLTGNTAWAAPQTTGVGGYLASSILLGPNTNVEMQYVTNGGSTIQSLLTDNNSTGFYTQYYNTVELAAATNTSSAPQIVISLLNTTGTSVVGNIQVVPLTTNVSLNQFDQSTVNRQIDQSFNYYKSRLEYKPIPSYLVGWDFPLNPAQFLGSSISAQAVGANGSYYAWDQTILYQSANSGITVSRGSNGELVLTAATDTQMAVIQYLTGTQVNELLNGRLSVNVEAKTSNVSTAGYNATISLWYGTGTLPSTVASNLSIVAALNSTGYPTSFNQPTGGGAINWAPVPRSGLGLISGGSDAQFAITKSSTTNFNNYSYNGWNLQGSSNTQSATLFAIVLGTAAITSGDSISINSISLVPGDIPTRPAPQAPERALFDCQQYYWKTYALSVLPGTATATNGLLKQTANIYYQNSSDTFVSTVSPAAFDVQFPVTMQNVPTTVTLYSTAGTSGAVSFSAFSGAGSVVSATDKTVSTFWTQANLSYNRVNYIGGVSATYLYSTVGASNPPVGYLTFHATVDSRLGQ
jgi:hypothetical protein